MKAYKDGNKIYIENYNSVPLCEDWEDYVDFLSKFEEFDFKQAAEYYCDLQGWNLIDLDLDNFNSNIFFGEYLDCYDAGMAYINSLEDRLSRLKCALLDSPDAIVAIAKDHLEHNARYFYYKQ